MQEKPPVSIIDRLCDNLCETLVLFETHGLVGEGEDVDFSLACSQIYEHITDKELLKTAEYSAFTDMYLTFMKYRMIAHYERDDGFSAFPAMAVYYDFDLKKRIGPTPLDTDDFLMELGVLANKHGAGAVVATGKILQNLYDKNKPSSTYSTLKTMTPRESSEYAKMFGTLSFTYMFRVAGCDQVAVVTAEINERTMKAEGENVISTCRSDDMFAATMQSGGEASPPAIH